jgi:hypothetical protein
MTAIRLFLFISVTLIFFGILPSAQAQNNACCTAPSTPETVTVSGQYQNTQTQFLQTIQATDGNFNGRTVRELTSQLGTSTCSYSGSLISATPPLSGGHWIVGSTALPPVGDNGWGFDTVGYPSAGVEYIRASTAHGVTLPCTTTLYQTMQITCGSGYQTYQVNNVISIVIYSDHIVNTRKGVSQTINN